jgi:hypothetical protein
MKYYILAGCAIVAAVATLFFTHTRPQDPHAEWRKYAVEPETAVRPQRFEEMKYQPGEVEIRAPASAKNKAKKKSSTSVTK